MYPKRNRNTRYVMRYRPEYQDWAIYDTHLHDVIEAGYEKAHCWYCTCWYNYQYHGQGL